MMPRPFNPNTPIRIKAAVRQRDGHACTGCGMTNEQHKGRYGRQLEAHRIIPGSLYTVDGCVTLCRKCHGPQPRRKRGQPDLGDPARNNLISFRPRRLETRIALQRLAAKERRSLAQMIDVLIEDWLIARGLLEPESVE